MENREEQWEAGGGGTTTDMEDRREERKEGRMEHIILRGRARWVRVKDFEKVIEVIS